MFEHKKSIKFLEESQKYFAGGVGSNHRLVSKGYTLFIERGKGSKIYDVDGNEYIDYMLAQGPLILGHCPDNITKAVIKQLERGSMFGASEPQEIVLAKKVCECFPSVDLVRFTNSASEAVQVTLRLARAYTGKSKIMKFEGCYHGWFDNVLISVSPKSLNMMGMESSPSSLHETNGQYKGAIEETLILPWNKPEIVEKIVQRYANEVAALIIEPIPCNNGVIPPSDGFLETIREITRKNEIILIFDETITGFRIGLGGAQEYYNIKPDLTVFGKAMAAGYPIAGFGGKKEIMDLLATNMVAHMGTYNSNSLCVAAAISTLNELSRNNGEAYTRMTTVGNKLMQGIKEIFSENNIPVIIQGFGPFFSVFFQDKPVISYRDTMNINSVLYTKYRLGLLDKGIRTWPTPRGLWYISTAHTDEDIEITLDAMRDVVKTLKM
jgi:glutamate-1-semialdehyde 2,1-aminomutase